ncbi:C-type lectin domain family 4 member E-like isoform X2 [Arapaima gigas]
MAGEIIYSDIKFTCRTESDAPQSQVSHDYKHDESGSGGTNPAAARLGLQGKKSGSVVAVWVLLCVCVLLVGVVVSLGVFYAKQQEKDLQSYQHLNRSNITVETSWLKKQLSLCNRSLSDATNSNRGCKACPPGWEFGVGKCYYFSNDSLPWNKSAGNCITMGGHLVIINSEEEQLFLLQTMKNKMIDNEDKFWIGLSDAEHESRWIWMDKTPLKKNVMFWLRTSEAKEPDNWTDNDKYPEGEDCARMGEKGKEIKKYSWYDAFCWKTLKRVCEGLAATQTCKQ